MKLDIIQWPNPILGEKCQEITNIAEFVPLADAMLNTLKETNNGIGMAAPQVGKAIRLVVLNVRYPIMMFNPVIVNTSKGKMDSEEGCLSLENGEYTVFLRRWKWVAVEFQDENENKIRRKFREMEGRCVQHEMDHLNGVFMLDYKPAEKKIFEDAYRKGKEIRKTLLETNRV